MKRFLSAAAAAVVAGSVSAQAISSPEQLQAFQLDKTALERSPQLRAVPNSVLVKFRAGISEAAVSAALRSSKSEIVRAYGLVPGLVQLRTSGTVEQALTALASNPSVEFAEPDYVIHANTTPTNDPFYSSQWGLNNTGQNIRGVTGIADADIDMPEAWDTSTGIASFVIADIDTGAQWNHPDLDGNIWNNTGEIAGNGVDDDGDGYIDDIRGWDFYSNDNNPTDTDGHGTHTAGTIGAEGNNSRGVAGVNWRCKIMPLRFLGPGGGATSDAIAALDFAVSHGVKVSNNSWGGAPYSSSLFNAINSARTAGHIFVAAAGNDGTNNDSNPYYPASYNLDNIISVAATDNRDRLASFSNYGATRVDIGAPGVDVLSTYIGGNYAWSSGTSMAAPHVAGVAALVWQENPGFTYAQVRDRIFDTARPIAALAGRCVTGGVLNASDALTGGNATPIVDITAPGEGTSFAEGASVTFTGSSTDAEDGNLSSSLVWMSNLDGVIGFGASFSTSSLSRGDHTVTATSIDTGGAIGDDIVHFSITSDVPPRPTDLHVTNNADGSATVTWTDNSSNETRFQLVRQHLLNHSWTENTIFNVPANTTSYTDAPGAGTFRYRVRAKGSAGFSDWTVWRRVFITGG